MPPTQLTPALYGSLGRLGKDAALKHHLKDSNHGSFIQPEAREGGSKEAPTKSKHEQCFHTTSPDIFDLKERFLTRDRGIIPSGGLRASRKCPQTRGLAGHNTAPPAGPLSQYNYNHYRE
jgi:hypothetical protein